MSLNMKTLTQALAKTAAVIEKTVQTTVQEVSGPRPLQDYDLLEQVGSGGPALAWRLYSARPRPSAPSTQYPLVCVWILDKRALSEARARAGLSKAAEDAFLDLTRADASRLVRLRHPGVVHVVQSLDESKTAMAMVTEPLFASVANALGYTDNITNVPKDLKGMEMGLLEVKHGLLQVAESLDFIHNNARLIHRAISPETVFITLSGAWKLGGFGFAVSAEQMSGDSNSVQPFHYAEYDVEDSVLPLQPSLNYTAPELVRSKSPPARCSADVFSLGCLTYHLVTKKPLVDCQNNVKMERVMLAIFEKEFQISGLIQYMNSLTYISSQTFSAVPPELVVDLQRMLSTDEFSRPSASDFTGSSFFRDDTRLRALRFLDHMLGRDNMQKSEFLKALSDMWKDFDARILRYKVLPPLCEELRNVVMQPMILPMVLTIAESQDKTDFELSTLPALVPVLNSASGETMLLLVKHAELLINKGSHENLIESVLPLLVRAYDDTDPRIQEEVLRRTVPLAKQLDMHLVKQAILPRVHSLALRTTVAAVRVNALRCLGDMVSLDKHAVQDILQTLQRCTAVDRSAPTLMCTLAVANSILKQHGIEFTAEHVLPLLCPLLTAQQLNVQQFAKFMLFVKDILRKIEEKRGVTVTDSGVSDIRVITPASNGVKSEQVQKAALPAKSSSAWDEDWGPPRKGSGTMLTKSDPNPPSVPSIQVSQPPVSLTSLKSDSMLNQQLTPTPSVDLEWPPRNATSGFGGQIGGNEKQNQTTASSSDGAFDDMDPFANWPPKPGNSVGGIGYGITTTSSLGSSMLNTINLGSMANKNPVGQPMQRQGGGALSTDRLNGIGLSGSNSIGFQNQNNPLPMLGNPNPSMNSTTGRKDLGSIFSSTNNKQQPLRIAPPPSMAVGGRGRGRGQGQLRHPPSSQASSAKVPNGQAPLLDLL